MPATKAAPPKKPPRKPPDDDAYDRKKKAAVHRRREATRKGQDIAPIPKVANRRRRNSSRDSLRLFCETYLRARFPIAWSPDHLKMIAKLEAAILRGGLFAFAMPRGSGKTTLAEAAAIWALLYAHRFYVVLIGATEGAAEGILASIRDELDGNPLLLADFPEVCYPIACLEGEARRCIGQHIKGKKTRIAWTKKRLVLPTVNGSKASGSVVNVAGITGNIRGVKIRRADGTIIRPDFVMPDDPQTDDSARHPAQVESRERVLESAILRLAGPKVKISAVMPCTVIAPHDLADRFLDKSLHPEWSSERSKMLYRFPTDTALWDQYGEERRAGLRADDEGARGNAFYAANRERMDAGAVVGWEGLYDPSELSAIQHAMNWHIDSPRSFAAEAQNEPIEDTMPGQLPDLVADDIARKLTNAERGLVAPDVTRITAMIDVGGKLLHWLVGGWAEGFKAGTVLDYGVYPGQNRAYYRAEDARPALADLPGLRDVDDTARIYAGLRFLVDQLLNREFPRVGGGGMKIDLMLIDAGDWTDTIHQFCRQSPHGPRLMPSKGVGISTTGTPMPSWPEKTGERKDKNGGRWVIRPMSGSGRGREVLMDVNHWKSFVAQRLTTPMAGAGCLSLFGKHPDEHRLFADHICAEYRISGQNLRSGLVVEEWKTRPGKPDNHWFDCLVGCAVAASVQGLVWSPSGTMATPAARKKIRLSDLYARKQQQAAGR